MEALTVQTREYSPAGDLDGEELQLEDHRRKGWAGFGCVRGGPQTTTGPATIPFGILREKFFLESLRVRNSWDAVPRLGCSGGVFSS